jgi:hypothetical protein
VQPHTAPLQGLHRSAPLPAPASKPWPAARGRPFRGGRARLLIQARPASGAADGGEHGPGGGGGGGLDEAELAAAAEQLTLEALHLLGAGRAEHAEYLLADGARVVLKLPAGLGPCRAARPAPAPQLRRRTF